MKYRRVAGKAVRGPGRFRAGGRSVPRKIRDHEAVAACAKRRNLLRKDVFARGIPVNQQNGGAAAALVLAIAQPQALDDSNKRPHNSFPSPQTGAPRKPLRRSVRIHASTATTLGIICFVIPVIDAHCNRDGLHVKACKYPALNSRSLEGRESSYFCWYPEAVRPAKARSCPDGATEEEEASVSSRTDWPPVDLTELPSPARRLRLARQRRECPVDLGSSAGQFPRLSKQWAARRYTLKRLCDISHVGRRR